MKPDPERAVKIASMHSVHKTLLYHNIHLYMSDSIYTTDAWVVEEIHFPCFKNEIRYIV